MIFFPHIGWFWLFEVTKYFPPDIGRHYRRLQKKNNIAAVEIHKKLLGKRKYVNEFNYSFANKDSQNTDRYTVLSYANKLNLSIIANQINDNGFYFKTIALRNAYDVFLLSKKTNAKVAVNSLNKLSHPLNCFLAVCDEIFNKVGTIEYIKNEKTALHLRNFNSQFTKPIKYSKFFKIYVFIKIKFYILYRSIMNKEYRVLLFKRVTDKNWYKEKGIQLGIKS